MVTYWWLLAALAAGFYLGITMMVLMYVSSEKNRESGEDFETPMETATTT